MHHSWWKFIASHIEHSMKHLIIKSYTHGNKRDAKMFIVYLSCHFGMGKLPSHGARGTPVDALYDTIMLATTRTYFVTQV
jgi:hypothetical protein